MEKNENLSISVFLIITFLFPLISIFIVQYIHNETFKYLLLGLRATSPSIACLICVFFFYGKKGLTSFLNESFCSTAYKSIIILSSICFILVIGNGLLSRFLYNYFCSNGISVIYPISTTQLLIIGWSLFSEEIGWRGFLQNKIHIKNKIFIPLIVGCIWSLWHYHFYLFDGFSINIGVFIVSCIADSYIYYLVLLMSKNNIIPISIYHFATNLTIKIFNLNMHSTNNSYLTPYMIFTLATVLLGTISALILIKKKWLTTAST